MTKEILISEVELVRTTAELYRNGSIEIVQYSPCGETDIVVLTPEELKKTAEELKTINF